MKCAGMEKDYPFRVKMPGSKVVHAATSRKEGPDYRYMWDQDTGEYVKVKVKNRRTVYEAPCGCVDAYECKVVSSTEAITCKRCLKTISTEEEFSKDDYRYILQEKESGYFFRKSGWQKEWVVDFRRATLYKSHHAAEGNGRREVYKHVGNGKEITVDEYRALPTDRKKFFGYASPIDKKKYVVRKVRLVLE